MFVFLKYHFHKLWKLVGKHQLLQQSRNQWAPSLQSFSNPLEKCVRHCLKNLGRSQKTLRPAWCPKLITGLSITLDLWLPFFNHIDDAETFSDVKTNLLEPTLNIAF